MTRSMKAGLCALSLVSLLAGCPPAEPTAPEAPRPPKILSFQVSATEVEPGREVTLSWSVADATRIRLHTLVGEEIAVPGGATGSGEVTITLHDDTVFILTASSDGGEDTAAVSVRVQSSDRGQILFIASPPEVLAGQPVTLVWNAPGASRLTLTADGAELHVTTRNAGSIELWPNRATTYTLTANDGRTATAQVTVRHNILAFTADRTSVEPGEMVTLQWQVGGADRVVLSAAGRGVLDSTTDPARIADGSFTDTVPATLPDNGIVTYVLQAEQGTVVIERELTLFVGADPRFVVAGVPDAAKIGGQYTLSWQTELADKVEVVVAGEPVYVAVLPDEVAMGAITLPSPSTPISVRLRATNARGGEAIHEGTVIPVGAPVLNDFSVTPTALANGGDPVTISWDITDARNVVIRAVGAYDVVHLTGLTAEKGSVTVYPNKDTTYELLADNGFGDAIQPVDAQVTVTTPAKLIFNPTTAPKGAMVTVVGSTVPNGGEVLGLPVLIHNAPGEAFVDIRNTGVSINYAGPDTSPKLVTLPEVFTTRLFGQEISGSTLTVSINGWFKFHTTTITGPDTPSPFPTTALEPFAIAPFWADLYDVNGEIYYQLDTVNGDRRLIVQWDNVEYDPVEGSIVTVQAQVHASGKIVFAYKSLEGVTNPVVSIGVVNGDESDALYTTQVPAEGDTFTLFGRTSLPATIRASGTPFVVRQLIGATGFIDIETAYPIIPPGQFVVTEINPNPAVPGGQWIELENTTTTPIDLGGWEIDFGGGLVHAITGTLMLPAGGRVVLAQTPGAGDGLTVDYVYGTSFSMSPGMPLAIGISGGAYTSLPVPVTVPAGASWQVGPVPASSGNFLRASGANSIPCLAATAATYGSNGQRGTPGAANTPCPLTTYVGSIPANFEPIAATGNLIPHTNSDASVEPVTTGTPFLVDGVGYSTLYVGSNGWITTTPVTCTGYPCHDSNLTALPGSAPSMIAAYWDDLDLGTGGVYWERRVPGIAPNDGYTIISWEGVMRYSTPSDNFNFQVKFFDDGAIEFHFGTMTGGNGSSATSWWTHPSGMAGWLINANSSTSPGIQPNTAFRFAVP